MRHFLLADPREVAIRCGVDERLVRSLQDAGGLRRVRGLGPRGVECLVGVGIDATPLLAASDPARLHARLRERWGAAAPPAALVRGWVVAARASAAVRTVG